MTDTPEVIAPPNPAIVPPPPEDMVSVPKKEFDDLTYKASQSSQNFERLQKTKEDLEIATAELARLQNEPPGSGNDEDITRLSDQIKELKEKQTRVELIEEFPVLKETWAEFETFRKNPDNAGMQMKTAAKAFLTEKELLTPARKGLENPTGGGHAPVSTGMSAEEVEHLRKTDFKRYRDMVKAGQIKVG